MWGKPAYPPLENMKPQEVHGGEGVLAIRCKSPAPGWFADIILNFPAYRLEANVFAQDLKDDGTAEFVECTMAIEQFIFDWNCNGCLEVWKEGDVCVGRCNAFMPVNVYVDFKAHEKRVAELKAEAERRRASQGAPAT